MGVRHVIDLPFDIGAPAAARAFAEGVLSGWPADRLDDVLLCVSEIVTNGLLHAAPALAMELDLDAGAVTVAVSDGDADTPAEVGDPGIENPRGRGLYLVSLLASDWGTRVDHTRGRKTVWCEIDLSAAPDRARRSGAAS